MHRGRLVLANSGNTVSDSWRIGTPIRIEGRVNMGELALGDEKGFPPL